MDSSQNSVLDNELSVVIVDRQEEDQVEPTHGSPSRSSTPRGHDKQNVEVPKVGMKFDCDDSAYEFYRVYAQRIGFSVRKQFVKQARTGQLKRRAFCCSKEGERSVNKCREQVSFHHPVSRVGCLAQMACQLQKDGMLEVVSFHEQHNHELASSPIKHTSRSNLTLPK